MRTNLICLALVVAGCHSLDKSTGTTAWGDLGINIGPGGGDGGGGMVGPDMATYLPMFPYTLTPLTQASTQTANISLYFSVTDANNRGVPGLSCGGNGGDMGQPPCSMFWIDQEDGVNVDPNESHLQVEALSGNNLDVPTVLVLDLSGNIIANGNLPNLQAAADTIIDAMLPEQRMAIVAFADQPNLRIGFTAKKDAAQLHAAVKNLSNASVGVSSNLFGAMVQALGMWQDGFNASDPAMTTLTAGMVIVVASGEDMAGVKTYNDVIQARQNKRVIAVGVGANGAFGSVNTLEGMATGCGIGGGDGGVRTGGVGGACGGYFSFNTYADLKNDVNQVTGAVESLAHSIYFANYCSPKRSGSAMQHTVTFTVVGNAANEVSAICRQASFSGSAPSACAQLGNGTTTEVCQQSGNNVTCCPPNAPYWCQSTNSCYYTAAQAQADCQMNCVQCGGSGVVSPGGSGTDLQPGPAIHVTFNANGYATGQCPYFWGPQCKALQACCPTLDPRASGGTQGTYSKSCVYDLTQAVGTEATCTTDLAKYCPSPVTTNCMAMQTCCASYPAGATQDQCYSALYQAWGTGASADATCMTQAGKYCPTAGSACDMLRSCCNSLGPGGQVACLNQMVNNSASCAMYTPEYCPPSATEPNCVAFAGCCASFAATAGSTCYSDLVNYMDNTGTPTTSNSYCSVSGPYSSYVNQYCPTTANCVKLQQCCSNKSSTVPQGSSQSPRDLCEQQLVNAQNNDTSCMTTLTSQGC